MKFRPLLAAAALGALMTAALPALAQHTHQHGAAAPSKPGAASELAEGEVRRIDTAKGMILLKHGEIRSINMGPMTMNFKLRQPGLDAGLKVGDKVRFAAEQQGEQLIVTRIERLK